MRGKATINILVILEDWIRIGIDHLLKKGNPYLFCAQNIVAGILAFISVSQFFDPLTIVIEFLGLSMPNTNKIDLVTIVVIIALCILAAICFFIGRKRITLHPYSALKLEPVSGFNNQIYIPEDQRFKEGGRVNLSFRLKVFPNYQDC